MGNWRGSDGLVAQKVTWRQCPYCARWFIAHYRQVYDNPICGQRYRSMIVRLEKELEEEKYKPIHYASIKGEMYERRV